MAGTPLAAVVRHLRRLAVPPHDSDDELLRRFAACRDEAAFARLVERHGPLVLGVCRRVLRDADDSDDAFQATFFVLARKAASVRRAGSLAGWLYRVAYRIALQARAERVRRRLRERQGHDMRRADQPAATWDDLRPVLDEELQALPDKYRLPVVLCYLEGRTLAQAAADLGWPRGTVAGRLARARDLLRERLTRRGVALSAALLSGAAARVAVPPALAGTTARAATLFAAGTAGASASAALAEAALRALAGTKVKAGAALLLGLALLAAGTGLLAAVMPVTQPPAAGRPQGDRLVDEPRGKVDALGDPLPPGAVARIGTVRLQQGCDVGSLRFSPDGRLLASSGCDGTARLWDVASGKEVRRFRHEEEPGRLSIAGFTPDGKTLATAGADNEVRFWDVASEHVRRRLPTGPANCLDLSADGKTLAVASEKVLHLWDWAAGKELCQVKDVMDSVAFAPDGKRIAFIRIVNDGDGAANVSCLDLATGAITVLFPWRARSLAFSPDWTILAGGELDDDPPHAVSARLCDVATGRERLRLNFGVPRQNPEVVLSFSPDGKLLATASDNGIRLWDVATGGELRRCQARPNVTRCLAFSPDGKLLAASGMSGRIQLFDVATGMVREPFARPPDIGRTVRFLPDGKSLLTADRMSVGVGDGAVAHVWDAATGNELSHFRCYEDHATVVPSADGTVVAVQGLSEADIRLLQVPSGKELGRLSGGHDLAFALSAGGKKALRTARARHGSDVITLWDVAADRELQRFDGRLGAVEEMALAPDGMTLASTVRDPNPTLRVWDVATGKDRWSRSMPAPFGGPTFSPDGRLLATFGLSGRIKQESYIGEVRLWDAATGQEVRRWDANDNYINAAAFAPDGHTLATGGGDSALYLWEVATGKQRRALCGHADRILSLGFAPDGRRLASASQDGTVLVWDLTAPPAQLSVAELEAGWDALAGDDAAGAYRAIRRLAADPERAIPMLRERLRPAPSPEAKRVAGLVADLDSDQFAVREAAAMELAQFRDGAGSTLREALRGKLSPEATRRLRQLLDEADGWTPERLREWRALEVLEQAGTPEARQLLEALAKGAPAARQTAAAAAAVGRLTKRTPIPEKK